MQADRTFHVPSCQMLWNKATPQCPDFRLGFSRLAGLTAIQDLVTIPWPLTLCTWIITPGNHVTLCISKIATSLARSNEMQDAYSVTPRLSQDSNSCFWQIDRSVLIDWHRFFMSLELYWRDEAPFFQKIFVSQCFDDIGERRLKPLLWKLLVNCAAIWWPWRPQYMIHTSMTIFILIKPFRGAGLLQSGGDMFHQTNLASADRWKQDVKKIF